MKQKCLLCEKEYDSLEKGSHIIPDFLIRSSVSLNEDKNKRNDNQIIFNASSFFEVEEPYIGRVGNDGIEKLTSHFPEYKKNLDAGEKYNDKNSDTIDDIFCNNCEKKLFGQLEDYFSKEVYRKIIEQKVNINVNGYRGFYAFEKIDMKKVNLFTASIIWRCSKVRYNDFCLPKQFEDNLRKYIIGENGENPIAFRLSICSNDNFDQDNISCILTGEAIQNPFLFIINNVLIEGFLSLQEDIKSVQKYFRSVDNLFEKDDFIQKNISDVRKLDIPIINKNEWSLLKQDLKNIYVEQSYDDFENLL